MKNSLPAPLERLRWFQDQLNLDTKTLEKVGEYRSVFLRQNERFAKDFHKHFYQIPETRVYIEHEKHEGYLQKAWTEWFGFLFGKDFGQDFLTYQWFSGLRHAKVGIDHNLITLGYSFLRQFCHKIVKTEIPEKDRVPVLESIDKMVDFCLLIETQAFISATTQCDIEMVSGISHQMRNPLMIIGGNVNRLKRKIEASNPVHDIYDDILEESKRLENMVKDVNVYSEMFQKEPEFSEINLEELIAGPLMKLQREGATENPEILLNLNPEASLVKGDPEDLETMFFYLLENCLEAADPETPLIKISSRPWSGAAPFIEVEVFNNCQPPNMEDVADLFVPFYSLKPRGSGFGLAIAQLAARKSLGDLHLEPVQDKGLRCMIKLPAPFKANKEKRSVKK